MSPDAGETAPTLRAMGHAGSHPNAGGQVAITLAVRGRGDSSDLETRDDGTANAILAPGGGRGGVGCGAVAFNGHMDPVHGAHAGALDTDPGTQCVAQPIRGNVWNNSDPSTEASMHVREGLSVRRLTPRECERLQGFSDDYTLIQYRGKPAADGPRYKALGNSFAVPVVRWIGKRITMVEAL